MMIFVNSYKEEKKTSIEMAFWINKLNYNDNDNKSLRKWQTIEKNVSVFVEGMSKKNTKMDQPMIHGGPT